MGWEACLPSQKYFLTAFGPLDAPLINFPAKRHARLIAAATASPRHGTLTLHTYIEVLKVSV